MRENMGLYRGKTLDDGEWVEGSLVVWADGTTWIVYNPTEDWVDRYEVDPATIGEDTGLTDKNGKRIFEGDVLREPAKNEWEKINFVGFEVFWHDNDSCDRHIGWQMNRLHFYGALCGADIYPISFRPEWASRMEIVGNVHDNPEPKGDH